MKSGKLGSEEALETDDHFEMANLFPRTTGLAMTVWSAHAAIHATTSASKRI